MKHPFNDEDMTILLEAALWCLNNDRQRDNLGIQLDMLDEDLLGLRDNLEKYLDEDILG